MLSQQIRKDFLGFFKEKGHIIIPSASLIPENDPTVLFTTAGMHPLVPFLMGEKHPAGNRLTNIQKCLRTNDINEVGDSTHNTFFEMLGYWSLGDYFKKESIHFTFDFYTNILGFKKNDISVTVFEGDQTAPFDGESYNIWKNEIGIPEERIYRYSKKENWWGPAGQTGPCGPCTEMFIDTGVSKCDEHCGPACDCGKFIEIGNNVFMEYFKANENSFEKLKQKNVDVGLGFERLVMFSQNKTSVYDTDLFTPIIKEIEKVGGIKYGSGNIKAFRIIADHLRAATFILAEKIEPSNVQQGYVARRLIRRAVTYSRQLKFNEVFTSKIADVVIKNYQNFYPELNRNKDFIIDQLTREEEGFRKTLEHGLREFEKGKDAFVLYTTYGFPIELTLEIAKEKGIEVDLKKFEEELKKHQELSRTASVGMFKGGLTDSGEKAVHYHTATHLLLAALRQVLGDHVYQRGSNITTERMRFDFSHPEKMTEEQIKRVEEIINQKIKEDLPVICQEMSLEEARKKNMMGIFENKYGEQVKTYAISEFSREICGGPHARRTSELGHFQIIKEESSGAGVRRIKATLN